MLRKLIVQVSHYSLSGVLVTIAGLISFPILTRLLDVGEYGLLSLISGTLGLITAFGKGGLQFSIVRFYSDIKAGRESWDLTSLFSTVVYSMTAIGLFVTLIWLGIVFLTPDDIWGDGKLKSLFAYTSILVVVQVLTSAFSGILQAQQRSATLSIFQVVKRYSVLLAVVVTLLFISNSLFGLYTATIAAQCVAVFILGRHVLKDVRLRLERISPDLLRQMLLYGLPLLGSEFSAVLLGLGDRYLINWMMGPESLGAYAAAFNLCRYVKTILIVALVKAIRPIYLRIWAEKGEAATKDFLERTLYFYLMVSIPVIAGISLVGPDLLSVLASEKYASGAAIIPYVIAGMMAFGTVSVLGAGLHIKKQGFIVMALTLISAASNIVLNLILIPIFGLQGAAIATLISYTLLAILYWVIGSRTLPIGIPWGVAIKFSVAALLMYFVIQHLSGFGKITTLLMQLGFGAFIYVTLIVIVDVQAREFARSMWKKAREYK